MWSDNTPKFDLHRHLGGCLKPETVHYLLTSKRHTERLAWSLEQVRESMVCRAPVNTFKEFLDKFELLNHVVWDEEAVATSIRQVVKDIADDEIDYCEMSLSIEKYHNTWMRWTRAELVRFIRAMFDEYCREYGTRVSLILSLKMEGDRATQRTCAKLLDRSDVADCLGGIDIVGDERFFSTDFYAPLFREWKSAGKVTVAHAGEAVDAETGRRNVRDAIRSFGVTRIRHGIAAAEDQDILMMARDNAVGFDVSLHSNWLAGTTRDMTRHHLPRLLRAGCLVTLGTDDPVTFGCNLADEYRLARKLGLDGDFPRERQENHDWIRSSALSMAGSAADGLKASSVVHAGRT